MEIASVERTINMIEKGSDSFIGKEDIIEKLKNGKTLVIKLGLDPTAPDIHLGHTVVLRKVRQLQDLGHKAVIIIGDFTARIGDPSGKSKMRPKLSVEVIKENAKTYFEQVFKVLDKDKTEIRYNSQWLEKLGLEEVLKLASTVTVARMLERDDFSNRFKNEIPIGIHEFFYPLLQAKDSVEIDSDIEIGGSDQTFNILMGRTLQKSLGLEAQGALLMPLLEGLDGVEKMSKSLGNYIGINEKPEVVFKKVMEIKDNQIIKYFELVTDVSVEEINLIKKELEEGINPKDIKLILARTITSLYFTKEELKEAEKFYEEAFQKKGIPDKIEELLLVEGTVSNLIDTLVKVEIITSKSQMRRLITQGGVKLNGEILTEDTTLKNGDIIKIGKKEFRKIVIE